MKSPKFMTGILCIAFLAGLGCNKDAKETADVVEPDASVTVPPQVPVENNVTRSPEDPTEDQPEKPTEDRTAEPPDASELYDEAAAALESGDSDLAFRSIRKARSLAPNDTDVAFLMAYVLAERNRFSEAVKMLDELARKTPDARLPVLGQTADWLVHAGEWEQAESRFRSVLQELPDATMAQRALGQLLLRQGRRHEAAKLLRQLCRDGVVEPSNLRSLLRLAYPLAIDANSEELEPIGPVGEACAELGRSELNAAKERLRQIESKSSAETELLGRIYVEQDDAKSLRGLIGAHQDELGRSPHAHLALAVDHQNDARHREAILELCEAVLADPTDALPYTALARSLSELGLDEVAAEANRRAELIGLTQQLGEEIGRDPANAQKKLAQLADSLDQLQRPFEALAWRTLEVKSRQASGEFDNEKAAEEISRINAKRLSQIDSGESTATKEFLRCGVDPENLPQ